MRTSATCALLSGVAVLMAGCAQAPHQNIALSSGPQIDPRYGVAASPRVALAGEKIHTGGGHYFVGRPYVVAGHTYYPSTKKYDKVGMASWYGADFHGRRTANGEIFSMAAISAASKTMPLPSYARVTNLTNKRSIIVRVNDRGPYAKGRIMDVSKNAATLLGFIRQGTALVHVQYLSPAPLGGHDTKMLMASLRTDGQPATLNGITLPPGTMLASNQVHHARQMAMADLGAGAAQASSAARPTATHVPLPPVRPFQISVPPRAPARHVARIHDKPHVEKVSFYDSAPIALSNHFVKTGPVNLTDALKMRPLDPAQ
ncbi:MAG: septal ring lytic transglycosylase RlpA family protein [Hyphomicrobiales bacterium]|nr:septal ring lytic transglycosylase RlpA family protein [Hyphomicrobiales bacterium]